MKGIKKEAEKDYIFGSKSPKCKEKRMNDKKEKEPPPKKKEKNIKLKFFFQKKQINNN